MDGRSMNEIIDLEKILKMEQAHLNIVYFDFRLSRAVMYFELMGQPPLGNQIVVIPDLLYRGVRIFYPVPGHV
jgi:hypothetical protein